MSSSTTNITVVAEPYEQVSATAAMRRVPRFGHNNDFSAVLSNDDSEVEDYVLGLVFIAGFVMAVFLSWSILLLVFKCMGKKVGFLSGRPFQNTTRAFRVRVTFVSAVILFILFAVLLVVNGITNLQDTLQTVSNTNQEVSSLLADAQTITSSLRSLGQSTVEVRDVLVGSLGNFCPGDPNLEQETGYDFDSIAAKAIELLNVLGDFITNDVVNVQNAIDSTRDTSDEVDQQIENIDVHDWQSLIIIIPYVLVPSFLLVGCIMAWFRVSNNTYNCTLAYFWTPFLILITTFSYIMCGVVSAAAVANADFCSGGSSAEDFMNSPDGTVVDMLRRQDFGEDSLVFEALRYYISQCISEDPFSFVRKYQGEISMATDQVKELDVALEAVTIPRLNLLCDKEFEPFEALVDTMGENLDVLQDNAAAALSLLGCDRITPIYLDAVHSGTCDYSVTGITWTFACFLVVAFMGMLMLTFRSSMYESEEPHGESMEQYANGVVVPDRETKGINVLETEKGLETVPIADDFSHPQPTAPHDASIY